MAKGQTVEQVEDGACRTILRRTKLSVPGILRQAGLPVTGRMTFSMLREFTDFPGRLLVTAAPVDPVVQLMSNPAGSSLHNGWVRCWEANPGTPGRKSMVAHGLGWGYVVAYDSHPQDLPYLRLTPHLRVSLLRDWVDALGWSEVDDGNTDE